MIFHSTASAYLGLYKAVRFSGLCSGIARVSVSRISRLAVQGFLLGRSLVCHSCPSFGSLPQRQAARSEVPVRGKVPAASQLVSKAGTNNCGRHINSGERSYGIVGLELGRAATTDFQLRAGGLATPGAPPFYRAPVLVVNGIGGAS